MLLDEIVQRSLLLSESVNFVLTYGSVVENTANEARMEIANPTYCLGMQSFVKTDLIVYYLRILLWIVARKRGREESDEQPSDCVTFDAK